MTRGRCVLLTLVLALTLQKLSIGATDADLPKPNVRDLEKQSLETLNRQLELQKLSVEARVRVLLSSYDLALNARKAVESISDDPEFLKVLKKKGIDVEN